jgi:hypothetical protein
MEKNITILLPIHKLDETYQEMFNKALQSIDPFHTDVKVLIICPPNVRDQIISADVNTNIEYDIVINEGKTDYVSQINLGIDNCSTEWFSILEVDDVYTENWSILVNSYKEENPNVDVFLPVVKDINVEGKFTSFTNESVWAYSFSNEQGFVDNEILLEFQNFQTSGGLFKTEKVKEFGKLKENIKLTFNYEFLLRLTHNDIKIMTIPRIGYVHVNFREDSLFWQLQNIEDIKLDEKETEFWINTAKKEFFFNDKRDIKYEKG